MGFIWFVAVCLVSSSRVSLELKSTLYYTVDILLSTLYSTQAEQDFL